MSIRVHELAKILGISSKELVEKLHKMKVDVKTHMSVVPEETVELLKKETEKKPSPKQKVAKTKAEQVAKTIPSPPKPILVVKPATPLPKAPVKPVSAPPKEVPIAVKVFPPPDRSEKSARDS